METQARWLVDGMNVVGSRPDGWWRDRTEAMRRLVAQLEALAAAGAAVAVVFDGRPRALGAARVEVAFAHGGGRDAADREIARRVAADPAPATLRVATSDRALAERAAALGAEVVPAGALRRRLDALAEPGG